MRRVVITGASILSSMGDSLETFWGKIQQGQHGIGKLTRFDNSDSHVKLAGEIQDFDCAKYGVDPREARRMDLFIQYALAATNMAVEDAGSDFKDLDPFRVGVILSTGIGGVDTILSEEHKRMERGAGRVSPFFIPMMIPDMAAGTVAIHYGFKGSNFSISSACSSSGHAIGESFRSIKFGFHDVMVAGGSENPILPVAVAGFDNMKALSRSSDPNRASIPFDLERNGFVMAEGSAVLILEELEHAKARGAHIYAEVVGYGSTDDAYHITSTDPEGAGAARAMLDALQEAGLTPEELDYINAHGTSTEINDKSETLACKNAFGTERASQIPISSTKSMTGHMLGAAGSAEALICALALRDGVIPPTANYKVKDPNCDLDYVVDGARKKEIQVALSNSFGFGGHNCSLCLKKYSG